MKSVYERMTLYGTVYMKYIRKKYMFLCATHLFLCDVILILIECGYTRTRLWPK